MTENIEKHIDAAFRRGKVAIQLRFGNKKFFIREKSRNGKWSSPIVRPNEELITRQMKNLLGTSKPIIKNVRVKAGKKSYQANFAKESHGGGCMVVFR